MKIQKENIIKFLLFGTVLTGFFWLGGTIFRGLVSYRLFESFSLIVRSELTSDAIEQTMVIIGLLNIYVLSSFILFLIFYFLHLKFCKIRLKENGWFFMITIIIIMFLPVEAYTFYLDLKFTLLVYTDNFSLNQGLSLLIQRISALSGLPAIAIFSYITAIFLLIFQPLTLKSNDIKS